MAIDTYKGDSDGFVTFYNAKSTIPDQPARTVAPVEATTTAVPGKAVIPRKAAAPTQTKVAAPAKKPVTIAEVVSSYSIV